MKLVRPETWYMVWWALAGLVYLVLQGVSTYYVVYMADLRALAEAK
jgi:hypothetical protein